MALDRRTTHGLVQALLHARNRKDGGDPLTQASTASLSRSYSKPIFAETKFSSASQPAVATDYKATSQSPNPMVKPRPHPFRDPAEFLYTSEVPPVTGHSSVRPVAQPTTTGYRPTDGESVWAKDAMNREKNLPKVRHVTSGEVWSEFLGGIAKGIPQTLADIVAEDAKARQAMVDGIYIDTPNPQLFEPPKSSWDYMGREIAPGIMATTRPVKRKPKTWYDKKIGKVEPPKDLKPGTTLFGDDMHPKMARFVVDSFPEAKFDVRVGRGQKGVDVRRIAGPNRVDPRWEFKPNNPRAEREFNRQVQEWGYDEPVRVITYDEFGNLYDGFGYR